MYRSARWSPCQSSLLQGTVWGFYPSCSERRALMHTSVRLPLAAVANLAQAVHQDRFGGDHTLAIDHRVELLIVGDRG